MRFQGVYRCFSLGIVCIIAGCGDCHEDESVKLIGGLNPWIGYVQVTYQGRSGVLCGSRLSLVSSYVICRQLGYRKALDYSDLSITYSDLLPRGIGSMVRAANLRCRGGERHWRDCPFTAVQDTNCSAINLEPVAVVCENVVRLANGTGKAQGRVEQFVNGEWGTICGDGNWTRLDASAACRDVGFHAAQAYKGPSARFGMGKGRVISSSLTCYANATSLTQCGNNANFPEDCGHDKDAGAVCSLVRLNPMGHSMTGRGVVEVFLGSTWRALCGYPRWHDAEATIICKTLGFPDQIDHGTTRRYNRFADFMHIMSCSHGAESLSECYFPLYSFWSCGSAAYVKCADRDQCSDGSHGCSSNAVCENTNTSYACVCPAGYRKNGTQCKETPLTMETSIATTMEYMTVATTSAPEKQSAAKLTLEKLTIGLAVSCSLFLVSITLTVLLFCRQSGRTPHRRTDPPNDVMCTYQEMTTPSNGLNPSSNGTPRAESRLPGACRPSCHVVGDVGGEASTIDRYTRNPPYYAAPRASVSDSLPPPPPCHPPPSPSPPLYHNFHV